MRPLSGRLSGRDAAPGHDPALRPLSMLLVDEGVVLAAAPGPDDAYPRLGPTMDDFFSAAARRERGLFYGARIALYPGEIDELW
jgi:hypothetical protein